MHTNRPSFLKGLLLVVLVASFVGTFGANPAFALFLPLPQAPDRGTIVGSLPSDAPAYGGGIVLVPEKQTNKTDRADFLGRIDCSNERRTVFVTEKSDWGLSITGPLSEDMAEGVLEAIRDLRPPKEITFEYELVGSQAEKRTWTHNETVLEITTYKIYVARQLAPAENELIGYLVIDTPIDIEVRLDSSPCAQAQPATDVPGGNALQDFINSVGDFFNWLFVVLPNDLGIYVFGTVRVYSAGGLAAIMHLLPGESKTVGLPPGSYNAQAVIRVIGIPFEMAIGNVAADVPILLTVTLLTVEYISIILGIITICLIIAVIYKIFKRMKGREPVAKTPHSTLHDTPLELPRLYTPQPPEKPKGKEEKPKTEIDWNASQDHFDSYLKSLGIPPEGFEEIWKEPTRTIDSKLSISLDDLEKYNVQLSQLSFESKAIYGYSLRSFFKEWKKAGPRARNRAGLKYGEIDWDFLGSIPDKLGDELFVETVRRAYTRWNQALQNGSSITDPSVISVMFEEMAKVFPENSLLPKIVRFLSAR